MLGSDHKQTIAAVSHLAAYMGRTGKGINHIFQGTYMHVAGVQCSFTVDIVL